MSERERQPWERQVRESTIAFAAFCQYRDMGAERSIAKAVVQWLSSEPPKRAPKRSREHRRYLTVEKPENYVRNKTARWKVWSKRWQWVRRARAFDDHAETVATLRAVELRAKEAEDALAEAGRQRKTRLGGARVMRMAGSMAAAELLAALQAGEHKQQIICEKCGAVVGTDRLEKLIGLAGKAALMFDKGAMHERLEEKEPTVIVHGEVGEAMLQRLLRGFADILRDEVVPTRWEPVGMRIDDMLKTEMGNGKH